MIFDNKGMLENDKVNPFGVGEEAVFETEEIKVNEETDANTTQEEASDFF